MAESNEEFQEIRNAAQAALTQFLGYLEPLCHHLNAAGEAEGLTPDEMSHGLPRRAACLLADAGFLEGLRLKSSGALSHDLLEFIQELAMVFELDVELNGAFRLPFVATSFRLSRKSMNPWREQAWRVFHSALLSSYAMQPLHFREDSSAEENPLERSLTVVEGEDLQLQSPPVLPRDLLHGTNNLLTGILNYAHLILQEHQSEPDLSEKVGLIQEAARKLAQQFTSTAGGVST